MRRADIEVPNLAVDVTLCSLLQRRLYLCLFRDSGVLWRPWIWPAYGQDLHLSLCEKSLRGKLVKPIRDHVRAQTLSRTLIPNLACGNASVSTTSNLPSVLPDGAETISDPRRASPI